MKTAAWKLFEVSPFMSHRRKSYLFGIHEGEYIFFFCDGNETEHFNSETGVLLNHNLCISEQWAQCVFSIRHLVTLQQRQPALWALNISRIYCVFTIRVTIKHKHTRLLYNSLVKHSEQVVLQYSKNMTLWWVCNKRV